MGLCRHKSNGATEEAFKPSVNFRTISVASSCRGAEGVTYFRLCVALTLASSTLAQFVFGGYNPDYGVGLTSYNGGYNLDPGVGLTSGCFIPEIGYPGFTGFGVGQGFAYGPAASYDVAAPASAPAVNRVTHHAAPTAHKDQKNTPVVAAAKAVATVAAAPAGSHVTTFQSAHTASTHAAPAATKTFQSASVVAAAPSVATVAHAAPAFAASHTAPVYGYGAGHHGLRPGIDDHSNVHSAKVWQIILDRGTGTKIEYLDQAACYERHTRQDRSTDSPAAEKRQQRAAENNLA
ncbi:hypothetical protein HPB49_002538 [Dermacentor silvarum]|uniref:Uncharacterized protein n=1 Tax=Dermacentor silvarum TaxID=543639 RepID=A0ACB8D2G1_DERSI|nr:hypothetical protein HPB49_002538 [Dermacentor silvarum]